MSHPNDLCECGDRRDVHILVEKADDPGEAVLLCHGGGGLASLNCGCTKFRLAKPKEPTPSQYDTMAEMAEVFCKEFPHMSATTRQALMSAAGSCRWQARWLRRHPRTS